MEKEDLLFQLRKKYPNGHDEFISIMLEQIALHDAKNHDYTKGGSALSNFNRLATIFSLYPDLDLSDPKVTAVVQMMKQVDALLWGLNQNIQHVVEGLDPRCADIGVFATIIRCMLRDEKKGKDK